MSLADTPSIIDLSDLSKQQRQPVTTASDKYKWTVVRDLSITDDHENMPHVLDAPPIRLSVRIKKLRIHYHGTDMIGGKDEAEVYFNISGGADGEPHKNSSWAFSKKSEVISVKHGGGFRTFDVDWPLFTDKPVRWDFWVSTVAWEEDHGLDEETQQKWENLSDTYLDILGDLNDAGRQPWDGDGSEYAAAGAALGHIIAEIISTTSDDKIGEDFIKYDRTALLESHDFEFESDCYKGSDVDCYITYEVKRTQFIPIKPQDIYIPESMATGVFSGIENYQQCLNKMIEYIAKLNSTFDYDEWQEFSDSTKSDPFQFEKQRQTDAQMSLETYFMKFDFYDEQLGVIAGDTLTHPLPKKNLQIYLDMYPEKMPARLLGLQMYTSAIVRYENGQLNSDDFWNLVSNSMSESVPTDHQPPAGMVSIFDVEDSPEKSLGMVVRWTMDKIKIWERVFNLYSN